MLDTSCNMYPACEAQQCVIYAATPGKTDLLRRCHDLRRPLLMTHSLRASYAVFQLLYGMRWKPSAWLTRGYWRRTRGQHSQSLVFYQQYLLPVLLHHVVVGFKGRLRAEPLLLTDAKDSTTLLYYGYGTSAPMVAPDLLVLWSVCSYFLLACFFRFPIFIFFFSSRVVSCSFFHCHGRSISQESGR